MSAVTIEATAVERVFVRADADGDPPSAARPAPRLCAAPASPARARTTPDAGHRDTTSANHGLARPGSTPDPAHHDTANANHRLGRAGSPTDLDHRDTASAASALGRPSSPTDPAHRDTARTVRAAGPRARLVRTVEPAAPVRAAGPRHVVPPTVAHRLDVLRVQDRSPVLDAADEDRGAVPAHDPGVLAGRIALATVEVLGGRRPIGQLARWLTPGVLDALQVRAALTLRVRGTSGRAPQVRRVRTSAVDEHTLEAGVVVEDGAIVRAVALRLETHRGAWRATVLEVG
ncbi:Rv3235 family protein [Cellulomonas algicola]|uniref:Rv3235 family protein n=1 Tax=Cellulomonas algicola TaxID=2071633 RepID=UPI001C3FBB50|nr:Rv3235 family protein [Cellulomonas algicola]